MEELKNNSDEEIYKNLRENEMVNKQALIDFEEKYPDVLNNDNLDDILSAAKKKLNDPK